MKFIFAALMIFAPAVSSADIFDKLKRSPIVEVEQGEMQGGVQDDTYVFMGVPFAEPPVGSLRWKEPQPPKKFAGVYKALKAKGEPVQKSFFSDKVTGSEDCLYLNIWVPKRTPSKKLPVMYWITGGAFVGGSGTVKMGLIEAYNGAKLAEKGGVIVVTVNYRVGPLGFLALPELAKESNDGANGNYGMLDQIAGLKWVQRNIERFGGDPENITIFGESAGGTSVLALVASEKAQGLFAKAIVQSGPLINLTPTDAHEIGNKIKNHYARGSKTFSIDDLRKIPAEQIARDFSRFSKPESPAEMQPYGPVIDGSFLRKPILQVIKDGNINSVPLLIGTNQQESTVLAPVFFKDMPDRMSRENYVQVLRSTLPPELVEPVANYYTPDKFGSYKNAFMEVINDFSFHFVAHQVVEALSKTSQQPIYRYLFSQKALKFGAGHALEIPYVFHSDMAIIALTTDPLFPIMNPLNYYEGLKLSDQMVAYWTNFAASGNPNGVVNSNLEFWPSAESGKIMELKGGGNNALDGYLQERMDFWSKISPTGR